jgi:putative flippase GtrA
MEPASRSSPHTEEVTNVRVPQAGSWRGHPPRLYTDRVALLARLTTPWQLIVKELSAFGVVGAVNFCVDLGIFNLLHFHYGVGVLTSKIVSTSISTTLSYFMNRHWSFSHRARTGLRREYLLFFVLNVIALLIALGVLAIVHYGLGFNDTLSLNVANIVGVGIGTVFRFWSYKRWVFLSHDRIAGARPTADLGA